MLTSGVDDLKCLRKVDESIGTIGKGANHEFFSPLLLPDDKMCVILFQISAYTVCKMFASLQDV